MTDSLHARLLAQAVELLRDHYTLHRDPESAATDYEEGIDVPCAWCEDAKVVIDAAAALTGGLPQPQNEEPKS